MVQTHDGSITSQMIYTMRHKCMRTLNVWILCVDKLTRKRNATHIFPQHFVSKANINAIFIYMYATRYTLYGPLVILYSIHHFRSSQQRCTKCLCSSCYLNMRRIIYLLYIMYTQHEFHSLINMHRLNLAERNRLFGVLACGISQTVVAGQYNVSRSTILRLVERVNQTQSFVLKSVQSH